MHRQSRVRYAVLCTLALAFEAGATCTAGNPASGVPESTPTSAFVDNGDGTVTHGLTGLMWKKCPEGMSGPACSTGILEGGTWQEALNLALTDTTGGYADWRLPTEKELESIVETCGYSPSINQTVFPGTPTLAFWTSSTNVPTPSYASAVYFLGGEVSKGQKGTIFQVRLVRGGHALGAFDANHPLQTALDVDGNGKADALTDGLLIIRYLFGLRGAPLVQGAVGPGAERTTSTDIENQIKSVSP